MGWQVFNSTVLWSS